MHELMVYAFDQLDRDGRDLRAAAPRAPATPYYLIS
jgi:hypothetical protein